MREHADSRYFPLTNSYRSSVAANFDSASARSTLPTHRRRTSDRASADLGNVMRYSIGSPTATDVCEVNRTPEELTFFVSPTILVFVPLRIISKGIFSSKRWFLRCSITLFTVLRLYRHKELRSIEGSLDGMSY